VMRGSGGRNLEDSTRLDYSNHASRVCKRNVTLKKGRTKNSWICEKGEDHCKRKVRFDRG
jgi:hypothetical protein